MSSNMTNHKKIVKPKKLRIREKKLYHYFVYATVYMTTVTNKQINPTINYYFTDVLLLKLSNMYPLYIRSIMERRDPPKLQLKCLLYVLLDITSNTKQQICMIMSTT